MNWYMEVLKKYAEFNGRARRKEYWMFILFNIIIALVLGAVSGMLDAQILVMLYSLAIIVPSLAVAVRRLHDTGRSGAWIFISLVPVVGGLIFLYFMVIDGQPGDNQYGANPKGVSAAPAAPPVG